MNCRRLARFTWILALMFSCASACGCVQRRLTIRSEPPGALVYVDNSEIGTTPISTSFLYYGTREIRLVKDGYETLTVMQRIPPPWYQIPPLDFVSENLVPGEVYDRQTFTYRLVPQTVVPAGALLERAQELRGRATASGATLVPGGTAAPVSPPPAAGVAEPLPAPGPTRPVTPPAEPVQAAPPPVQPPPAAPGGTRPQPLPPTGPSPYLPPSR